MAEATGLLKGFSVNNGWTAVEVEGAPKGISTKKADVAAAVKELVGQNVTVSFTEKPSDKINENTGQPYVNRWLNSVVPAANAPQAPAPAAAQASSSPPAAAGPVSTDVSIVRQVSWKAVAPLIATGVDWKTASKWAHSIEQDILRGVEPAFGAPDNSEDDIPF